MDEPTIINNIDRLDHLYSLVRHELKDLGMKLPKIKKLMKFSQSRNSHLQDDIFSTSLFGRPLYQVPSTFIADYGYVPEFLVEAAKVVDEHIETEGIFRKSGSLARQKELQVSIEDGKLFGTANIYDTASLIKQFFRELPEPIFATVYHESFIKCFNLSPDKDPKRALFLMCLLLPVENIGALRFIFHLLNRVASRCDNNKMTANNLALVMAPNMMHLNKGTEKMNSGEEKLLHVHTCIIELFIKNWELVGMVDSALRQQLSLMSEAFGTDDDLEATDNNTLEDSKDVLCRKKRKRSGSLTGFVSSIAQGFSKLRRSTDGRSVSMSSNSTVLGELSLASNITTDCSQLSVSSVTPCVMRKRQACEDAVPFSASKKKNILDNLPQRSALVSTPYTPASSVKRLSHRRHRDHVTGGLNSTTPAPGSKTSRKKLNMFCSPGKVKRQNSASARIGSPSPAGRSVKGRNFFRRLSGNRSEKSTTRDTLSLSLPADQSAHNVSHSDVTTHTDSTMHERESGVTRSLSSPTSHDPESSFIVVDDHLPLEDDYVNQACALMDAINRHQYSDVVVHKVRGQEEELMEHKSINRARRSKSVDSPGPRNDQCNTPDNSKQIKVKKSVHQHKFVETLLTVGSDPVKDLALTGSGETKRSRRDKFETEKSCLSTGKQGGELNNNENMDSAVKKSAQGKHGHCSQEGHDDDGSAPTQSDNSVMEMILSPPHGFGDQTMMEDAATLSPSKSGHDDENEEEIDVRSDIVSVSRFSTISGGTVFHRPVSGWGAHSTSSTSIVSYTSYDSAVRSPVEGKELQSASSTDSLLSSSSRLSNHSTASVPSLTRSVSSDSGRGSLLDEATCSVCSMASRKDNNFTTQTSENGGQVIPDTDHVVLRHGRNGSTDAGVISGKEMRVCDKHRSASVIEARQCHKTGEKRHTIAVSCGWEFSRNVAKMSMSAENLSIKAASVGRIPARSSSIHRSPGKRFNYKPHLEITRETHNLLARAGYVKPTEDTCNSRYVQVEVKSPKRSSHREEMMLALRSSFHERRTCVNASMRSAVHKLKMGADGPAIKEDSVVVSTAGTEKPSEEDKKSSITTVEREPKLEYKSEGPLFPADKISEPSSDTEKHCCKKQSLAQVRDPSKLSVNLRNNESSGERAETEENNDSLNKDNVSVNISEHEVRNHEKQKILHDVGETDKLPTLSGILDKEMARPVKIKRADMKLPRHESILNIQQAGIVSQNVRQFSNTQASGQSCEFAMPPVTKRGNSPVRIPTVFAKSEEKSKRYRQVTKFMGEGRVPKELPAIPSTSGGQNDDQVNQEDEAGLDLTEPMASDKAKSAA